MFSSTGIIRRFTPPTCTLEILAQSSPLSRWAKRPIVKDLQFKLHFDDPRNIEEEKIAVEGDRHQLDSLYETVTHYVQELLIKSPGTLSLGTANLQSISSENEEKADCFSLQPQGLLSHILFLGTLESEISGNQVHLSASQLFDLANALEEYNQELQALDSEAIRMSRRPLQPTWTGTAAAVLVAVGLTATVLKLVEQPEVALETAIVAEQDQQQEVISPEDLVVLEEQQNDNRFPASPQPDRSPVVTPTLPSELASTPDLSPPPKVVVPEQPKLPPRPSDNNLGSPPQPTPSPRSSSPTPLPPTPQVRVVSPASGNSNSRPTPSPSPSPSSSPPPSSSSSSPPSPPSDPPKLPDLPSLQDVPSSERIDTTALLSEETAESRSTTVIDNPVSGLPNPVEESEDLAVKPSTSVTTQISEVKQYFQQNWQPPENLNQSLEYSLQLNNNGSIQRIIPRGQAAKTYLDHTNMPLLGEAFVSPSSENPTLRLVLGADGSVNTFVESGN